MTATPGSPIQDVTVDELDEALRGGARLFDVRQPDEFAEMRVPGAVLVPLATVPERVEEFRGAGPAYVICRSGGRSTRACEILAGQGVTAINVAGGTLAWQSSGRHTDSGEPA